MKSLLYKLFPSFFQVNETRYIDLQKIETADLEISLINPGAKGMHTALGINDERADVLTDLVRRSFMKNKNSVLAISDLGSELYHPNELFFVTMTLAVDISNMHNSEHNKNLVRFN